MAKLKPRLRPLEGLGFLFGFLVLFTTCTLTWLTLSLPVDVAKVVVALGSAWVVTLGGLALLALSIIRSWDKDE